MPTREGLNMEQSFSDLVLLSKWKPAGGYWWDERIQKRQNETFFFMEKRQDNLMRWVTGSTGFVRAYHSVLRNKGAAGVDGTATKGLPRHLTFHWEDIKEQLLKGGYRPQAVRGVKIPKARGGVRQLGIPTVMDRLVQQSIHQVLSPVWEKSFSVFSYGFRPKRGAQDALEQANGYINSGRQWVVDLDLKSFFDRANHNKLMNLISQKVADKRLLQLIRRYLRSGIMEGGVAKPRTEGTPQGGPLSPLLSNILLNELDKELGKRGHKFVRYADDCSIFLKSKRAAERVLASISRFLVNKLHLEVNQEKTKIVRPINFTLLGHSFVPTYKKGGTGKYQLGMAKTSWERLKGKIKQTTRKTTPQSVKGRIEGLNQPMRGWANYFKNATGYQKFKDLDSWIRCRLRYCIWKQWKRPKRRLRAFLQLGIGTSWARRFAYSRMGGWAIACSPIMGTTVTEARLRQKGYIPFLEYYLNVKYGNKTEPKPKKKR
jgi:group II intron reverse transcriptase/maturase